MGFFVFSTELLSISLSYCLLNADYCLLSSLPTFFTAYSPAHERFTSFVSEE